MTLSTLHLHFREWGKIICKQYTSIKINTLKARIKIRNKEEERKLAEVEKRTQAGSGVTGKVITLKRTWKTYTGT